MRKQRVDRVHEALSRLLVCLLGRTPLCTCTSAIQRVEGSSQSTVPQRALPEILGILQHNGTHVPSRMYMFLHATKGSKACSSYQRAESR
jgi:hypothetical protein